MPTGRRVCESLHFVALAVWLGSLVMAGAVAAQVFPLLRALDAKVPDHDGFTGEQWLIVAGRVGDMVFTTTDFIQLAAVLVAVATLIASIAVYKLSPRRISTLVRSTALAVALLLVAYQLIILGPAMQQELHAYWTAAQAGNNDTAQAHRQAFDALHPRASRTLGTSALAVLATIVAGVWSITNAASSEDDKDAPRTPAGES